MKEIKASDLRIGNLVNYKYYNPDPKAPDWAYEAVEIVEIKKSHLVFKHLNKKAKFKIVVLYPIPLTEEWLLRFGGIEWLNTDELGYYVYIGSKKIYLKFVHSLQNIYFVFMKKKQYLNSNYFVFENGDIINSKTNKVIKPQDNGNGYKKVTLTIDGVQIQRYVHRLVGELFLLNKSIQINHKDGNKSNNHVSNLEWVTNSENQKHAHQNGLKKNGNELWNGKFSKQDIVKIFKLKNQGMLQYKIAEIMNVSKSTISSVLNKRRYKHIKLTGEELTINN